MSEYFRPKPSVVHENFDDETVIVNLETGCYFSLRGSADTIWALAAHGQSRSQIVSRICDAYTGDSAAIAEETAAFLDTLVGESLLEHADRGPMPGDVAVEGGPYVTPALQKYTDMEELLQLDPIHEVDNMGWPTAKPPGE
jgi:Coenzyme PQQ synthesis protein D (PqqD)